MKAWRTFLVAALALCSGCALTSRGESSEWQWFTPEHVRPQLTSTVAPTGPAVRLGRVTSGADLGRPIVFGDGVHEVGYYESRRWTERPDLYVRRSLERTLFQERGFGNNLDANAPTLNVEVLTFQEVKTPDLHAGRVSLRVVLSSDHVIFDETIQTVDRVTGSSFNDVVVAIGRALDAASDEVARRVSMALASSGKK